MYIGVDHLHGGLVARIVGSQDDLAADVGFLVFRQRPKLALLMGGHGLPRLADERRDAAVLLKAAAHTAVALFPVHINHKVAQLGRCTVAAGQQLTVQHYAAADTGAQRDHDHAAAPFACARAVLAPGGHVGVVIHMDGQAGALVDHLAQRDVVKFQIVGIQHGAGVHIDAAGCADAHPGGITQGQAQGSRHAAAEQRDTVGDVRRRAGQPGLDAVGQQQFPVQVGNAACDVGAAQIDPDTITHNLPRFFHFISISASACRIS